MVYDWCHSWRWFGDNGLGIGFGRTNNMGLVEKIMERVLARAKILPPFYCSREDYQEFLDALNGEEIQHDRK